MAILRVSQRWYKSLRNAGLILSGLFIVAFSLLSPRAGSGTHSSLSLFNTVSADAPASCASCESCTGDASCSGDSCTGDAGDSGCGDCTCGDGAGY